MPIGLGETHTGICKNSKIAFDDCALTLVCEKLVAKWHGLEFADNVRVDSPPAQSFPDQLKRRRAIRLLGMEGTEIGFDLLPALVPSDVRRLVCIPRAARTELRSLPEAFNDQLRGGLVRVKLKAEITQACTCEPTFNYFERRQFFGKKEHCFASRDSIRNDVRDRLGLPRAWRSLDYKILPLHDVDERAMLGCIGILDQ